MSKFTLIDRALFLKKTPLFATLDLDLLLPIADKLQVITYEQNERIFRFNEDAFRMYFLVRGSIEIRDIENRLLAVLGAGDFFGDESIFNEQPRGYEAICKSEAIVLGLSRTNLLTIISECPSVAVGLLQAYTSHIPFRQRKLS